MNTSHSCHLESVWEHTDAANVLWTVFILQLRESSILVMGDNHTRFLFRLLSVLILPLLIPIILSFIYVQGAEATGQLLMSMFIQLTLAESIHTHTHKDTHIQQKVSSIIGRNHRSAWYAVNGSYVLGVCIKEYNALESYISTVGQYNLHP